MRTRSDFHDFKNGRVEVEIGLSGVHRQGVSSLDPDRQLKLLAGLYHGGIGFQNQGNGQFGRRCDGGCRGHRGCRSRGVKRHSGRRGEVGCGRSGTRWGSLGRGIGRDGSGDGDGLDSPDCGGWEGGYDCLGRGRRRCLWGGRFFSGQGHQVGAEFRDDGEGALRDIGWDSRFWEVPRGWRRRQSAAGRAEIG